MRHEQDSRGWWVVALLTVGVGVSAYLVARAEPQWLSRHVTPAQMPSLDLTSLMQIDADLVKFAQVKRFSVATPHARGLAVAEDGRILVVGDRTLIILSEEGAELSRVAVDGRPDCVAVAGPSHTSPGRVYVGLAGRVDLFDSAGNPAGSWRDLGQRVLVTSIAVAAEDVFLADAENRVVLRCDPSGKVLRRIGAADAQREAAQFIVPSPHFDVAVGPENLLYVANPGARRIEAFSFDGTLESFWGTTSSRVDGFFGCCNPAHFAMLPDGTFVTSEKGVPRVKVYGAGGEFQGVVAGPVQLDVALAELGGGESQGAAVIFDVATDRRGRVLVLDPRDRSVRIFSPKPPTAGESE